MWDNTLVIFSSDNGGAERRPSGFGSVSATAEDIPAAWGYIVMAYIVMAYIVMTYLLLGDI